MGLGQKIWGSVGSWVSGVLQPSAGGTGATTLADGGIVIGNGTSAVEVVAPGATTEILVGGGTATKPVWTTATGTDAPVRANGGTLVAPNLGTPASGTLTNCTGLPVSTGVAGLGTGVGTALAVNVGSAGAPVVNGGALGTPSSGTVTNLIGTASININGTVGATTPTTGAFTTLKATTGAAAGQVLVSDANGNLSYADPATYANAGLTSMTNPKGMAQGIAMTAAASGSSGIQVADNANIDFPTNSFALVFKGSVPDWTPAADIQLMSKMSGADGYILAIKTTGALGFYIYDGGVQREYLSSVIPTFTNGTVNEIVPVVTVGAVNTTVDFYANGVVVGTQRTAANLASLTTTSALGILGQSYTPARYAGTVHHAYVLNFAPTAAEVLDMYRNGIPESWKWGSQTAVYTSNFSAGVDGFGSSLNVAITGNIDGIEGQDNNLRLTCNTTNGDHYTLKSGVLTKGKKYRLTADYYIPTGQSNVDGVSVSLPGLLGIGSTTGAWSSVSVEGIASDTYISIDPRDGASSTFEDAGGDDVVYIRNIVVTKLGPTLALEPEGIQPAPGQWLDSSSNRLHALQPATGSSLTRYKKTGEIRWTNTWAGTHEAQYIGGINQAILPANCYIESIVGVVSGATVEDIIIGDGSDTDHWVEITTGLAAGTYSFAIANRTSDGTNYKMVVDPDANFTGSIIWTIKYSILEA